MPICLVSACLLGNGRGRFGSPSWGEGEGAEREGSGEVSEGKRDAERETGRQTAKQMAARGGRGPGRELGWTPGVEGAGEPIDSHSSFGARKQM